VNLVKDIFQNLTLMSKVLELLTTPTTTNMPGPEIAGLVMGAIPLVLLAFNRIRTTLAAYNNLAGDLQSVLKNIQTAEGIFKTAVDQILSEVADEEMRINMLEDVDSFNRTVQTLDEDMQRKMSEDSENFKSTLQTLDGDLRNSLGTTYQAFHNSINEFQDRMVDFEKILNAINLDEAIRQIGLTSDPLAIIQVETFVQ